MEEVKACRICLIMDVRMFDLRSYPLDTYFEAIVGSGPLNMTEVPNYACSECAVLAQKYYLFKEKCLRGQSALYRMLNNTGKITIDSIKKIDRDYLNLTSNLNLNVIPENSFQYIEDEQDIKSEPEEDDSLLKSDIDVDITSIKQEVDCFDHFPSVVASSDDDEPLSFHKSNKEVKGKEKKKNKKKERKEKKFNDLEEKVDNSDEEQVLEKTPNAASGLKTEPSVSAIELTASDTNETIKKRKRGRPKKIVKPIEVKAKIRRTNNTGGVASEEIDLEEYVTIVKLSLEEQMDEITKRKDSSNYLNAPFQCNLCYKGFIDTHAWKHHVGKHEVSAGDIECPVCKFRFKTKRTLQKHAANHEKKYACKSCSYVSKTTTQAKQHQRWHKGVTYKCQHCDEVSTKWTSYLSHVRIKHPSEFICGACGYSFVSKLGLTMHRTMMHKDLTEKAEDKNDKEPGPYCEECDVKFISVEAWKRHMVTSVKHIQSTDFNKGCRVCGETFKNSEELRVHHRKEHAKKRPKNYGKKPTNTAWPAKCEHCGEEIGNAREYWTHFRRAHPDKEYPIQKNYICDICGKSFRGNAFLVYHKRTHFAERAYKCEVCPKAFFNRTNLQMHEKTHSDQRPYPCSVCFKAFKCKGALDRHFRCHTGVKPYECEVCGKAFGQSNSRKLHVRTVHLKQPAPYISRTRLERRNKTHTPKELPSQQFIYQ